MDEIDGKMDEIYWNILYQGSSMYSILFPEYGWNMYETCKFLHEQWDWFFEIAVNRGIFSADESQKKYSYTLVN